MVALRSRSHVALQVIAKQAGVGKWVAQRVCINSCVAQRGEAAIFGWERGFVRDFSLALGLHGNWETGWSRRTA